MTNFRYLGVLFFLTSISFGFQSGATKFKPIELSEKFHSSDLIALAQIAQLTCVSESGTQVLPGEKCTEPGSKNKLSFKLKIKEILFQRESAKSLAETKWIDVAFTAKSHWSVPEDNYASEIGKEEIFFLRLDKQGNFLPAHEAFFRESVTKKKQIIKEIKKQAAKK